MVKVVKIKYARFRKESALRVDIVIQEIML